MSKKSCLVAVTLLVALALTSCGDDAESDTADNPGADLPESSQSAFCEAFRTVEQTRGQTGADDDMAELHAAVEEMREVGMPGDASAEVRDGFAIYLDAMAEADSMEEFNQAGTTLTPAERERYQAFEAYGYAASC
jgi:hypothetical protein